MTKEQFHSFTLQSDSFFKKAKILYWLFISIFVILFIGMFIYQVISLFMTFIIIITSMTVLYRFVFKDYIFFTRKRIEYLRICEHKLFKVSDEVIEFFDKDVFQKLFKNPGKMMGMVTNIGNKIDAKIKSGELKESELMSEGMDLLNKMQSMPGMGDMQKMFSQMGIPGLGKGGKINMGAMEAQLNKNMKTAKMKERMQAKAQAQAHAQATKP